MAQNDKAALRFMEIEHKFLVPDDFDLKAFCQSVRSFSPEKEYKTDVSDTYFLVKRVPDAVYRHRYDGLLQHLTLKKQKGKDNEARTEINIELDLKQGNQVATVAAFLEPLDIIWSGTLRKNVHVFYFPDVEIVYYRATFQDRDLPCIEIEARSPDSMTAAQRALEEWEIRLGLDPKLRSKKNLLQLLVYPQLSAELRAVFEV